MPRVLAPWRRTGRIAHLHTNRLFAVSLALGLALVAGVSSPASAETNSLNKSETGQHSSVDSSNSSSDDSHSSGGSGQGKGGGGSDQGKGGGGSDQGKGGGGSDQGKGGGSGDHGSGNGGNTGSGNGVRGSDNPPVVVTPAASVVTETSDAVRIAATHPLPSAARAGDADTSGQLVAGGLAGIGALLAMGAGFVLRRREGEV